MHSYVDDLHVCLQHLVSAMLDQICAVREQLIETGHPAGMAVDLRKQCGDRLPSKTSADVAKHVIERVYGVLL